MLHDVKNRCVKNGSISRFRTGVPDLESTLITLLCFSSHRCHKRYVSDGVVALIYAKYSPITERLEAISSDYRSFMSILIIKYVCGTTP